MATYKTNLITLAPVEGQDEEYDFEYKEKTDLVVIKNNKEDAESIFIVIPYKDFIDIVDYIKKCKETSIS